MLRVFLLTEDDNDDVFYLKCLENLTGRPCTIIPYRIRRGGGFAEVRKKSRILLNQIGYTGVVDDTALVIAVDNDRSLIHPDHEPRPRLPQKNCRVCELERITKEELHPDRSQWPIPGALAVPVEMLESWLLLALGYPSNKPLPIFSRKMDPSAIKRYGKGKVKDQLKDLIGQKRRQLSLSKLEFYRYCAEQLDPNELQEKSPSFKHFKDQVDAWPF